jgi:2-polyprenyl-6-methoxyphenol hydroxylase-like FAD-dependent oxidoreductase
MERFDVVIVGARCAGASLATLLARRGVRVCVVDLATFPSDTPSTHVLQPSGVVHLKKLGVYESVLAADTPPLTRFTLRLGNARIDETIDLDEFGAPGLCIRRVTLDPLLVDAARAAGADVRQGVRVTGLVRDDTGRVTGVETNSGPVGADLVVGADGRNSTVARLTGAREYGTAPAGRLFMWGYLRGVPKRDGQIMLARIDDLGYLASPTDNGLYLAAVAPDVSRKREYMADRERSLREGIRRWPELHEIVGDAELEGPVHTVGSWHGFFRESAGPGWVLVGDAGQFKDPTPGQGISDSLRHSARLSDAIVGGLRGGSAAMDAQLQRWWSWRDRDSWGG